MSLNDFGYRVVGVEAGTCWVSAAVNSQWRNGPHWHTLWPDNGGSWCYQTKAEADERRGELIWLAQDLADWRAGCQCVGGFHGGYTCPRCAS